MTREELLNALRQLHRGEDQEQDHIEADRLLIEFINDPEIAEAYRHIDKWYA